MKKTKIIATIGPASSDYETLKQIIEAGANVVRLNMSHGSHEEQMERVLKVRKINEELNSAVGILLDTKDLKYVLVNSKKELSLKLEVLCV